MKKYVNNSFINKSPLEYKNGTKAVTSLPVEIFTDGQPVSSYTIKGNTQTSGTPSPQNPVTISGVGEETANLLNRDTGVNGYLDDEGNFTTPHANLYTSDYIVIPAGAEYVTQSYDTTSGMVTPAMCFYDSAKTFISGVSFDGERTKTFSVPNNAYYLRTCYRNLFTWVMLNVGDTALPYEPYGYKISISSNGTALTPIYLSEPLRKIGDVADTINSDGTVTRRIGKCVFQGTENWVKSGVVTNGGYYLSNPFDYEKLLGVTTICTHFECVENGDGFGSLSANQMKLFYRENSNAKELYLVYTPVQTAVLFKSWLESEYEANHPVTVYYIKATPTTESVTVPEITTTGGTATIDVDTTVKPSEVDLTYHGWHEHEPLKRENGSWS